MHKDIENALDYEAEKKIEIETKFAKVVRMLGNCTFNQSYSIYRTGNKNQYANIKFDNLTKEIATTLKLLFTNADCFFTYNICCVDVREQ